MAYVLKLMCCSAEVRLNCTPGSSMITTPVKLLSNSSAVTRAPHSRINQVHVFRGPAFDDQKVIEFPVDNSWQGHIAKIVLLERDRPDAQAIGASSLDDVERGQAVTSHATVIANFCDARLTPVIAQDHGEASRTAF